MNQSNNHRNNTSDTVVFQSTDLSQQARGADSTDTPFLCNICKRSYTRLDHLARHFRAHTREKPFTCEICHKSFSRVDILRRHTQNHEIESPNKRVRTSQGSTQSRVSRACRACAEGKLRCSENTPCERCLSKKITCEFATVRSEAGRTSQEQHRREASDKTRPTGSISDTEIPSTGGHQSQRPGEQDVFDFNAVQEPTMLPYQQPDGSSQLDELLPTQLPTPSTVHTTQGSTSMSYGSNYPNMDTMRDFDDLMMVDFIRDVMYPPPFDTAQYQHGYNTNALPDILDFALDDPIDFSQTTHMQYTPHLDPQLNAHHVRSGNATPPIEKLVALGQQAFRDSMWLWTPDRGDSGTIEQVNLALPALQVASDGAANQFSQIGRLSLASRDRVLSMILRSCEPHVQRQVVSCFPSAELLSTILSNFLASHSHQVSRWIHLATLKVEEESEDFLAALISSGAAHSGNPDVRKLGFAIQEALRHSIADKYEKDNRNTRDLRILQAYALQLHVGLWSGNRRKMEIAESFAQPLITMIRRAGHFRRKQSSSVVPHYDDDQQTIERKWRGWVDYESSKRLTFHIYLQDTASSLSLMKQPLISYAEICLDLPCCPDLWQATSPEAWKQVYLGLSRTDGCDIPQLRATLDDIDLLTSQQAVLDVQMSLAIVVSTIWSRVWQCLQMKTSSNYQVRGSGSSSMLTVNTYHQELVHAAKNVSLRSDNWNGGLSPHSTLLLELCMMHLNVSLEAVQLFAGKEGEEEARKVVPVLRAWIDSSESRQAVFHAGQVLLAAQQFPYGRLRAHYAVGVYHASLTLWAYAVLSEPTPNTTQTQHRRNTNASQSRKAAGTTTTYVQLDTADSTNIQRFLVLGAGDPVIKRYKDVENGQTQGTTSSTAKDGVVSITDTLAAMDSIVSLLASKNGDERSRPPMVGNLSKLIHALGKAAAEMKRKKV